MFSGTANESFGMSRLLFLLALLLLPSCAGMRIGAFGGMSEDRGSIRGTPQGGAIPYSGDGTFYGVFTSFQLTANKPQKDSPLKRMLYPDPVVIEVPAKPEPEPEPEDPTDPLALYTGAGGAAMLLAALVKVLPSLRGQPTA